MGGGTEAFPDLGSHCQLSDCRQLDFLPFECSACRKAFCLGHRSYKAHGCPNSDSGSRKVVVCQICSFAIETTGQVGEDGKKILENHRKLGDCDPRKHKKPTCPVRRCKEVLTFSNTATCKTCRIRIRLKHRFPVDHACGQLNNNKFFSGLASRSGNECGTTVRSASLPATVKAC